MPISRAKAPCLQVAGSSHSNRRRNFEETDTGSMNKTVTIISITGAAALLGTVVTGVILAAAMLEVLRKSSLNNDTDFGIL